MPESENLAVQILLYGFSAASVVVTVVATLLWKSLEKTRCREIKGLEAQALSKEGKATTTLLFQMTVRQTASEHTQRASGGHSGITVRF